MSTNINITVGDNALLDAAKLQQEANRQAQLNREASKRLEAQATAARTAALATQGRDANGNLITGAPFTQPQIERRPAANRQAVDVFGNFFVSLAFGSNTDLSMKVTSGDGLSVATVPWPTLEDFPDILLQEAPEGELRGAGADVGAELPLSYDSLGRLIGSGGNDFAVIWAPSLDAFFAGEDGLVTQYRLQASYVSGNYGVIHTLPTGRGNALVIIRTAIFKRATTRVLRVDRQKYYSQFDPSAGITECIYDSSPLEYQDVRFHVKSVEEFHVFAVSTNKARYIGLAPGTYVAQFKDLPGYKGFELSDLTVINENVETYSYYSRVLSSNCQAGEDEPVLTSIPYSIQYFEPSLASDLRSNSLVAYKLIRQPGLGGDTVTPSAYTVFTNPDFYPSEVPSEVTDAFVSSYLPAKAASLKWRAPDPDGTPYSYAGTPPVSWGTYTNGPTSILTDFPVQWRKSGRTPVTDLDLGVSTTVWDWNDPAYCREQALALGFSAADLTP